MPNVCGERDKAQQMFLKEPFAFFGLALSKHSAGGRQPDRAIFELGKFKDVKRFGNCKQNPWPASREDARYRQGRQSRRGQRDRWLLAAWKRRRHLEQYRIAGINTSATPSLQVGIP